jgi:hypothetical protein
MLDADSNMPIGRFGKRYGAWEASTTYVLALAIAKSRATEAEQDTMFNILGSYVVRRAVCDLTNKNYNKVFLQILKNLKKAHSQQCASAKVSPRFGRATSRFRILIATTML